MVLTTMMPALMMMALLIWMNDGVDDGADDDEGADDDSVGAADGDHGAVVDDGADDADGYPGYD